MYNKLLLVSVFVFSHGISATTLAAEGTSPDICHIKGLTPEAKTINIKGLPTADNKKVFDIKMFKSNKYAQDIKAITPDGDILPVKALGGQREGLRISVKVIPDEGDPIDIKALTKGGERLDVKAIDDAEGSDILGIKVIVSEGEYYPIKAICPEGHVFDVKAIRTENTPKDGIYDVKAFEMNYSSNP